MNSSEIKNALHYDLIADKFEAERRDKPWEQAYFDQFSSYLPAGARILDCGCGNGHQSLTMFLEQGHQIDAFDGSHAMLKIFKERYPDIPVIQADMLEYHPYYKFDGIIAWDSFFHLSQDAQKNMIQKFSEWLKPKGVLLFSTGPDNSVIEDKMFEVTFTYSSFTPDEYKDLLYKNSFEVLVSEHDEPNANIHMAWIARLCD